MLANLRSSYLLTICCAILILISSCTPILKKLYGIKKPDIESRESIEKSFRKWGLDETNVVCVRSDQFLSTLRNQGLPDASIFDHEGKYIEYRQTDTSCNAGLFQFIPDLQKGASYKRPDTLSMQALFTRFYMLDGQKAQLPEPADFYVLIYQTIWTGKLNKDHVKIWEDQAKANQKAKVKVIKVNLDLQAWWPEEEQKKLRTLMRNQQSKKRK